MWFNKLPSFPWGRARRPPPVAGFRPLGGRNAGGEVRIEAEELRQDRSPDARLQGRIAGGSESRWPLHDRTDEDEARPFGRRQRLGAVRDDARVRGEVVRAELTVADRFYPSTRRCSERGDVGDKLELSERTFHCSRCGHEADRDANRCSEPGQLPLGRGVRETPLDEAGRAYAQRPRRAVSTKSVNTLWHVRFARVTPHPRPSADGAIHASIVLTFRTARSTDRLPRMRSSSGHLRGIARTFQHPRCGC